MSEPIRQCGNEPDAKQISPQHKFTPDPWHNDSGNSGYTRRYVCGPKHADGGDYAPICIANTEANANLIAAAPEMYAALQAVINDEGLSDLIAGIGEEPPFWKQIQAVLAKAEGRAA